MGKLINILNDIFRSIIPESQAYIDVEKKKGIWEKFCKVNNGTIKIKRTIDNTLSKMEMKIPYGNYEIIYKKSDIHPLKIQCEFNNERDFRFQITEEDFIEKIIKSIHNKEIEIGNKEFDNKYLLVTNDKERLTKILSNRKLRDLIMNNKFTNLQIQKINDRNILFLLAGNQNSSYNKLNDVLEIFKILIKSISNY